MNNPMDSATAFCIAAVERDTGLGKDTLRVWERRYGFPKPGRDAKGERLYPAEQVEKLRLIRCLLDRGQRPSKVVGASMEDLRAMLETAEAPKASESPPGAVDGMQYVRLGRTVELAASLRQALLRQGLQRFVAETVAPLSEEVGAAWMRGEIQVSDEHAYTEQVQNVLRGAIGSFGPSSERPRVLLSTLPGEDHVLGLLMVEATLVSEGAACLSLGTRTPMADLCRAAVDNGIDVVGLSFSAAFPARQAIDRMLELRAMLPPQITLWAGGAAMRGKQKRLPGVRVVSDLDDARQALAEWRSAHAVEAR
ncbi:MerR family transcriptional regulator [Zoogloea sp.]|uniref:MerR family transcriptional regulator n=1 Tax=Zoogloea sp. TaxID=49181 RepID=UPI003FCE18A5